MSKCIGASEKEEFWRLVLHEQGESGLTIRAFCRREQLSEPSFFAWRKKLQSRDSDQIGSKRQPQSDGPAQFLPVEVIGERAGEPGSDRSSVLEITTPGGMQFRFSDSLAADRIRTVLVSMLQVESGTQVC